MTLPRFDRVVTSAIPRSAETAIAIGYAVDAIMPELCPEDAELYAEIGHHERWSWDTPFQQFADLVAGGGPTARLGELQVGVWRGVLATLPENGNALIISHGRVIETGLVTLIPDGAFASWDRPFSHCEGASLTFEADGSVTIELLRVPAETPLN